MKKIISTFVISTIAMMGVLPVIAQPQRASPHETIKAEIDGDKYQHRLWASIYGQAWNDRGSQNLGRAGALGQGLAFRGQPIHNPDHRTANPDWRDEPARRSLPAVMSANGNRHVETGDTAAGLWGIKGDQTVDRRGSGSGGFTKEPMDKPLDQFTMAYREKPRRWWLIKIVWEKRRIRWRSPSRNSARTGVPFEFHQRAATA